MERKLGRLLTKEEVVHHKIPISEGGTDDIENLMLFANNIEHMKFEQKDFNTDNRVCSTCKSNKTCIRKGNNKPIWYGNVKNGFRCSRCYDKLKYKYQKNNKQS